MKTVVYTAVFGGYDETKDPEVSNPEMDYVYITDERKSDFRIYKTKLQHAGRLSAVRAARRRKVLPHIYFPKAEFSLWHDGNIQLLVDPMHLIQKFLFDTGIDLACFKHPYRNSIYQEGMACINLNKGSPRKIAGQMKRYRQEGFSGVPLMETGVLLRRHTPAIKAFCETWWKEIEEGSYRDQLSFPYALWKHNIPFAAMGKQVRESPYFRYLYVH